MMPGMRCATQYAWAGLVLCLFQGLNTGALEYPANKDLARRLHELSGAHPDLARLESGET